MTHHKSIIGDIKIQSAEEMLDLHMIIHVRHDVIQDTQNRNNDESFYFYPIKPVEKNKKRRQQKLMNLISNELK